LKGFYKVLGLLVFIGLAVVIVRAIRRQQQDSTLNPMPASTGDASRGGASGGQKRTISRELLEILADPEDKGPVELLVMDGKEWLVNRRNGYRYPVEDGIPIMLIEEGKKYQDASLITA
jgi:uncharacterized protein